jgi:hypothetical protein
LTTEDVQDHLEEWDIGKPSASLKTHALKQTMMLLLINDLGLEKNNDF